MDIRMPEIFGWGHKKEHEVARGAEAGGPTEPNPYVSRVTMAVLILLILAGVWVTGYYFSEYITELFK